ncbi:MAG: bacteriohopanetetrol glucosamine biosynthesis glycosyltransferase HpnI [Syntrophobacteraceae bacterium]
MFESLAAILLFGWTAASIFYFSTCLFAVRQFASGKPEESLSSELPPVSILIPLCGVDFKAYDNYSSFCRLDYPVYQIIFGVQDPEDSSVPVIQRLIAEFPERDIRLVVGTRVIGQNPKVNNLHNMLSDARYEFIVIADSDIRVKDDYLAGIIPQLLDERVGLVTCFYKAGATPTMASRMEALGITADFAPGVLAARLLEGMTFALGATMATTKTKLESIGGMSSIADYLADDYMLGYLTARAGHQVRLSPYIVETVLPEMIWKAMIKHQIRWGRGVRACRPMGYLGSIVTYGAIPAFANVAVNHGSWLSILALVLTITLRTAVAWQTGVLLLKDSILKKNIFLLPIRDLFGFFIWCMSVWGCKVEWRGKSFKILKGGKMIPADWPG